MFPPGAKDNDYAGGIKNPFQTSNQQRRFGDKHRIVTMGNRSKCSACSIAGASVEIFISHLSGG
jgi:hypothetical protein